MQEEKRHYRMYKDKKMWVFVAVSVGVLAAPFVESSVISNGHVVGIQVVQADTNSTYNNSANAFENDGDSAKFQYIDNSNHSGYDAATSSQFVTTGTDGNEKKAFVYPTITTGTKTNYTTGFYLPNPSASTLIDKDGNDYQNSASLHLNVQGATMMGGTCM